MIPDGAAPAPLRSPGALEAAARTSFLCLVLVLPWSIAPMSVAGAACAALTLALLLARRARWPATPVDLAALVWLAALLLAALFAEDRGASLLRVKKGLLPALVPLTALHARERRTGETALGLLLASAGLAAALGLGVFVAQGASFAARARGPVGHYMTFAGQLLLFVSLAVAVALLGGGRRLRLLASGCAVLGAAALAATFTRSSWIGLCVALALMLALTRPRWLPALALLAAAFVVATPPDYRASALSIFDPHHPRNRERTYMWQAGLRMLRDHPITGVGLQDLRPIYARYRPPEAHEAAGHLHSVYVHVAATMGLVGLAALAALMTSLFRTASRGLRASLRRRGPAVAVRLGVTAALAGFFAAGLFEWNFGDEELLYALYTLVGLAWASQGWEGPA